MKNKIGILKLWSCLGANLCEHWMWDPGCGDLSGVIASPVKVSTYGLPFWYATNSRVCASGWISEGQCTVGLEWNGCFLLWYGLDTAGCPPMHYELKFKLYHEILQRNKLRFTMVFVTWFWGGLSEIIRIRLSYQGWAPWF